MESKKMAIVAIAVLAAFMNIVMWCAETSPSVIMNRISLGTLSIFILGGAILIERKKTRMGVYNLNGRADNIRKCIIRIKMMDIRVNKNSEVVLIYPQRLHLKRIYKICAKHNIKATKNIELSKVKYW